MSDTYFYILTVMLKTTENERYFTYAGKVHPEPGMTHEDIFYSARRSQAQEVARKHNVDTQNASVTFWHLTKNEL